VKATEVTEGSRATVEKLGAEEAPRSIPVDESGVAFGGDAPAVRLTLVGANADATISVERIGLPGR